VHDGGWTAVAPTTSVVFPTEGRIVEGERHFALERPTLRHAERRLSRSSEQLLIATQRFGKAVLML